ncbi:4Fe-4S dicluster domain-containing protein [Hydrogenobaculum acidophilum]
MAYSIDINACVSCYACEDLCPTKAIYHDHDEVFFIDPKVCVECEGFYDEPQCVAICPIDLCITKLKEVSI